jgi:ubiquinone/menaquinone biosynthesis C-methylase UbiE
MKNDFDRIALIYDLIARLFFGSVWKKVQLAPMDHLTNSNQILIVGGGTGKILEGFHKDQHIVYVERSIKMLDQAMKRSVQCRVDFVHDDYLYWKPEVKFDAIVFPFFLDCFQETELDRILTKSHKELSKKGALHVTDFVKNRWHQNFLIRFMHLFFRIVTGLSSSKLLDIQSHVLKNDFRLSFETSFYQHWIFYRIFSKSER